VTDGGQSVVGKWQSFNLILSCYLMDGEGQMADE